MKKAIVMVYFGTTHNDTRTKTIDILNNEIKNEFKEYDIFEAYTSRIILKKLKNMGIEKKTPIEIFNFLSENHYEEVLVQPTYIISGMEFDNLLKEVNNAKDNFNKIIVGKPLLESPQDYREIVNTFKNLVPNKENEALVLTCHGTDSPSGASYPMLEYMFAEKDFENIYTVSTKTFPLIENVTKKMIKKGITTIDIIPFMFVAGEHAKNDMAVKFKEYFEKNNIKVRNISLKGLGEYKEIREIFKKHLIEAKENKFFDLEKFKREYTK